MAKIKHIAITTRDPEKTSAFYKRVFDLQEVGQIDNEFAEGYYLTDGTVSLAILKYTNEALAEDELGPDFCGIHHIGFQVEDTSQADAKLRSADATPHSDSAYSANGNGRASRNLGLRYSGPDGVMIDVSRKGWVGTGPDS